MRRATTYLAVLAAVLLVWWALTTSGTVTPLILPALPDVAAALRADLADTATWATAIATTCVRAASGFLTAAALAIPLGVVLGHRRLLGRAYEPLLATITAVPLVVLYPVLAATLGIGTASKVVLGGLYAFFPIAIATTRAVSQVDLTLITAMRAMGAQGGQLVRAVVLPSALPGIVAGMRIGFGLALVTVIAGEFIGGSSGVGYQLAATSQGYHSADLFAWVVLTVALTVAANLAFTTLTLVLERTVRR